MVKSKMVKGFSSFPWQLILHVPLLSMVILKYMAAVFMCATRGIGTLSPGLGSKS